MGFPLTRMRRLRRTKTLRTLVRETRLSPESLIAPLFIVEGTGIKQPIASMPGQFRFSADLAASECASLFDLGIPATLLFGIPEKKDDEGSSAWDPDGVVQNAIRLIKKRTPDMVVITDVCLCEYTSHGHCGKLQGGQGVNSAAVVDNDGTLPLLSDMAVSHARAGADIVAPSDMMDGRVAAIRKKLDAEGFEETAILSYAVKYASAFYGPFREAAGSAPAFGDRKSYQMDPANSREAIREAQLDIEEGADMVMVKPALAYLDIIAKLRQTIDAPIAAYSVSGEYAMLIAAASQGLLDRQAAMMESLLSIKRAGADCIITYFAREAAQLLAGKPR
jgi:porphobilinogen synthase